MVITDHADRPRRPPPSMAATAAVMLDPLAASQEEYRFAPKTPRSPRRPPRRGQSRVRTPASKYTAQPPCVPSATRTAPPPPALAAQPDGVGLVGPHVLPMTTSAAWAPIAADDEGFTDKPLRRHRFPAAPPRAVST